MCGSIFSLASLPRSGSEPVTVCRTGAAPPYSCHHPSTSTFPQSQLPCSPGLVPPQPAVPDHTAASQHLLGLGAAKAVPLGEPLCRSCQRAVDSKRSEGSWSSSRSSPPIAASGATAPGAGWSDWHGWPCWEEGFCKKH